MAFVLTLVMVVLILYLYLTRNFSYWKKKNVPFVKPLLLFGNILDGALMRRNMAEVFYGLYYKTNDPVIGIFLFDAPCLLLKDLQIIKKVLVEEFQNFCDRSILNNKRDDPIGTYTLFNLKNPEWKEVRSKITPVFTSSKIRMMSTLIQEATYELIDYLKQESQKNSVIEIREVSLKFIVNSLTSTAFGVRAFAFKGEQSQHYIEARRISQWDDFMTSFRFLCYLYAHTIVKVFRLKFLQPVSVAFLKENFLHILHERAVTNNRRNDLIDILLEMKSSKNDFIDDNILVAQAVAFFMAGTETTSGVLGFALYEMALHPEIQIKVRNELNQISEKHGGINYEAICEMKYLDMCLKEILRKYPVLPFLERKCNARYVIPETGAVIDANTSVFISVYALHYDPKYFANPELFDPDRFSPENERNIKAFSYLPFGQGPRNCIGARYGTVAAKFGIASILSNFIVQTCSETTGKIKFNPRGIALSAKGGIKLKFLPLTK